jgi:nucleoside-diphosphate-sugar epimerase
MILLTGCTGFVGRHVLRQLLKDAGYNEIAVLVNRTLPLFSSNSGIRVIRGGLDSIGAHYERFSGITGIVHLAVKNRDEDNTGFDRVNIEGVRRIIGLGEKMQIKRLIYISSTGVYGHGNFCHASENTTRNPDTPFSKSKFMAEELLKNAEFQVVVLRHRFLIGEGDQYVVPGFIKVIKKMPFLPGAGKARISFVDVEDMARVIAFMTGHPHIPRKYEEYHVTNGEDLNVAEALQTITRLFSLKARRKIPIPFFPVYALLRIREKLSGSPPDVQGKDKLTSHRIAFLGRHNHFSNSKLREMMPRFVFRTFEESLTFANKYYAAYA